MKPLEWLSQLLSRHRIPKPDGRPLYQYRVTDDEFETLQDVLRDACLQGIDRAARTNFFDLAFVIYGAEWWRRHYEGHWGWDGIFHSFASDYQELPTAQRNILVESGLRRWQRRVRTTNFQRSFLGSIAIEGGLPLHQLASAGGWLQPTLHQVTRRYVELGEERFEASYIVSQYSQYMPKTFRRDEVYEILGDMITAVTSLKRTYDLAVRDDPVAWLNDHNPDWKTEFPLPLDDDSGNALLADMVRTAVASKQDTEVSAFTGTRFLSGVSIGKPKLCFELSGQPFYQLQSLFAEDTTEQIPHRLQVELFTSDGKAWRYADAYRIQWKGFPALKLNNQSLLLQGEECLEGIRVRFRQLGEVFSELDIGIDGLDRDVPWTFIERGDRWQLAGQASQKLSSTEAVVWVPDRLSTNITDAEAIGAFAEGQFLKIDQDLHIEDGDDNYSIRVNQEEETPVEYLLSGQRLGHSSKPSDTFVGKPRILVLNKITGQRNPVQSHRVRTRPVGSRAQWTTLADTQPGLHELQIVDDRTIMYRRRVAILPENTAFQSIPGDSPSAGSINANALSKWQVSCRDSEVRTHLNNEGSNLKLDLSTTGLPPAEVEFEFWQDNPISPVVVKLPFPSSGAVLVDPLGSVGSTSAELYTDDLHGYRLRYFPRRFGKSSIFIELSLIDTDLADTKDLYIQFQKSVTDGSLELALVDFVADIRSLLAISKNLDAYVRFSLLADGSEITNLKFRRFKLNIEPERTRGEVQLHSTDIANITHEELNGLELHATRLSQPDQSAVTLTPNAAEGMSVGIWQFLPELRSPGPWLIYSSASSEALVRPLLWEVPGQTQPEQVKTLHSAVCIDDPELRTAAFQTLFNEMVEDNRHSGWDYLRTLWERFKHLPLSTFQVWKDAISNSSLLAAMVIHLDADILNRLEEELPVMWELIPIPAWERVLSAYRSNLSAVLEDEDIVQSIIEDAIERIAALNDVMATVAKIVKQRHLDQTDAELGFMQLPGAMERTAAFLAEPLQALYQRQADAQWLELLKGEIQLSWDNLPTTLQSLMPGEQYFRATVVHMPFVLVHKLFTESDDMSDPLHVFKYRRLKQFDEDWYSAAFNYACGYWSQQDREI